MKQNRFLLAGIVLSTIGAAYGYHLAIRAKPAQFSSVRDQVTAPANTMNTKDVASNTNESSTSATNTTAQIKTSELTKLLDQVIADAIQRGTLDISRLTPQQLALLPAKFRKKSKGNSSNEPQLTPEEIAHVEQQVALGENAPPEPPPSFDCPDPDHLPDNYNNEYNKMILRQNGCRLNN